MKNLYLFTLLFLTVSTYSFSSNILASSFGWNGTDDTVALREAFLANVDTVIVDLQVGSWKTGPLIFDNEVNNKVIILERGVTVEALEGAYDDSLYNGLFSFYNCNNITLYGYEATLKMNKQEYINLNDGSEWRHAIAISGCNDFSIYGLEILDSGGDGIEISGIYQQPIPSTNIHIKNCKINNNYRQGISITSAENVLIEHCEITNTQGTPPAYGIDIEPDYEYDALNNIEIRHCKITGNEGGGLLLALWQLNQTSNPVSIIVKDCYITNNQNQGITIDINSNGAVQGSASFERIIIENQPANGIFSTKRESFHLQFNDIVIKNVGYDNVNFDPLYNMPIAIQKQYDYSGFPLGNIDFANILIDDRGFNRHFLTIDHWGESTQVENISGNFTVYNPNGVSYYIENPQTNVTIFQQSISTLPIAEISISTQDDTAFETGNDTQTSFIITQNPTLNFPLSIDFNTSGTALNRIDYDYFTGSIVLPSNQNLSTYLFTALEDELPENTETINILIVNSDHYSVLNQAVQLFIEEENLENHTYPTQSTIVFPNPVKKTFSLTGLSSSTKIIFIYDSQGKLIQKFKTSLTNINMSNLPSGMYFVKIISQQQTKTFKILKQ